jgi:hypothetical protein
VLGRRGEQAGPLWADCAREERKRPLAQGIRGLEEGVGRLERKEREREEVFLFFFKQILFKFVFQTFKLQTIRNPCIRIMMHKHLLFLDYFGDV